MSIQWTLIATFLYAEIAFVIILLLPFISAQRWQRFFKSKFLQALEKQANIYFTVFILILVLFFLDAIREMKKYTGELEENKGDSHSHLSAELQVHMKLFRAQRNFYIAGFSLFLWLVLRRLILLISAQATLLASNEATLKQAQNAADTASRLLEEATKVPHFINKFQLLHCAFVSIRKKVKVLTTLEMKLVNCVIRKLMS